MTESQILELYGTVRELSLGAHRYLRHGHNEKIYENSLFNPLRRRGAQVRQQHPLVVRDEDDSVLGEFFAESPHRGRALA